MYCDFCRIQELGQREEYGHQLMPELRFMSAKRIMLLSGFLVILMFLFPTVDIRVTN